MRNNMLNEGEPLRFITIPAATDTGNGAPTFSRLRASEPKGVLGSTPGTLSRLKVGAPAVQPALAAGLALAGSAHAANQSAPIPLSEIGAKATADYQGDALGGYGHARGRAAAVRVPETGGAGDRRRIVAGVCSGGGR